MQQFVLTVPPPLTSVRKAGTTCSRALLSLPPCLKRVRRENVKGFYLYEAFRKHGRPYNSKGFPLRCSKWLAGVISDQFGVIWNWMVWSCIWALISIMHKDGDIFPYCRLYWLSHLQVFSAELGFHCVSFITICSSNAWIGTGHIFLNALNQILGISPLFH